VLFHICARASWEAVVGIYAPASLTTEGFIHLSTADQWPRTRARFFAGRVDLVLLVIDPARLGDAVRYEPADGELFPHLYAALDRTAVIDVRDV
jgi:uncharacterized protein (DUF952 family)